MKSMRLLFSALGLAAVAAALSACGGGGDENSGGGNGGGANPPVAGSDVPSSATASSAGATAFVKGVAAASDNTAAPINVGDAVLATSDTDEPEGV